MRSIVAFAPFGRFVVAIVAAPLFAACTAAPTQTAAETSASESEAATAGANGYYAFSATLKSKKSGDAYVAAVNGQKMTCADGSVETQCAAFLDLSGVTGPGGAALSAAAQTAAHDAFLAGKLIVRGSFGKQKLSTGATRTALRATAAWQLGGETGPGGQVYLATQKGALFHDAKLNIHTTYDAKAIDLTDFPITGAQQAAALGAASQGGLLVRGTHVKDGQGGLELAADAFWVPFAPPAGPGLTAAQDEAVKTQLDNICGDTWCDGDYEWTFDDVSCDFTAKTCAIFATAADTGLPDGETPRTFAKSCTVSGFGSFDELVKTVNGYSSLQPPFYSAVTDCVQSMQSTIPPRPAQ